MARHNSKVTNWARLGSLIVKYWKGDIRKQDLKNNGKGELVKKGAKFAAPDVKVKVHFDTEKTINVVIPFKVWTDEELKVVERSETYKEQLGIVLLGGCR